MVFGTIEDAGADGIWTRKIREKLRMQDSTMKAALKFLEQKGYISEMKSVENPNKKMYIKANLRPSDRATGGPWFNDGELDQAFIAELERVTFEYIKRNSAYLSAAGGSAGATRAPKKGAVTNGVDSVSRGKKRSATEISGEDTTPVPVVVSSRESKKMFLPLPAGYTSYPTVSDVAKFIHESGITKNTTLSENDVQQLVDVLVFDGLVEPIRVGRRRGYRVARATRQDPMPLKERVQKERDGLIDVPKQWIGAEPLSNGLTEAPCGRCPVFDLCEEGGPVNPANCVYYQRWLGVV
jgi:DNA-directed RNA polymerase III subunit RPC6